jgi:hypothetical protein
VSINIVRLVLYSGTKWKHVLATKMLSTYQARHDDRKRTGMNASMASSYASIRARKEKATNAVGHVVNRDEGFKGCKRAVRITPWASRDFCWKHLSTRARPHVFTLGYGRAESVAPMHAFRRRLHGFHHLRNLLSISSSVLAEHDRRETCGARLN